METRLKYDLSVQLGSHLDFSEKVRKQYRLCDSPENPKLQFGLHHGWPYLSFCDAMTRLKLVCLIFGFLSELIWSETGFSFGLLAISLKIIRLVLVVLFSRPCLDFFYSVHFIAYQTICSILSRVKKCPLFTFHIFLRSIYNLSGS